VCVCVGVCVCVCVCVYVCVLCVCASLPFPPAVCSGLTFPGAISTSVTVCFLFSLFYLCVRAHRLIPFSTHTHTHTHTQHTYYIHTYKHIQTYNLVPSRAARNSLKSMESSLLRSNPPKSFLRRAGETVGLV